MDRDGVIGRYRRNIRLDMNMGENIMFTEVLKNMDKEKQTIIVTVIEGSSQGYRCILSGGEWIYESDTIDSEERRKIHEGAISVEKTCNKEYEGGRLFCDVLSGSPHLVVCGGGHVGVAIVKLAKLLSISVTVIEDRPLYANHAREAQADQVICDSFEHGLEQVEGGPDTYFVIVTRGHRYDKECLEIILKKTYAYLGMMGSRSRIRLLKEVMKEEGFPAESLDTMHAPIGLPIASETPEEIAVSILGEIIEVKNSKRGGGGFSDEILEGMERPCRKILSTIVMRKGSAPRQIGTKMLILEDGTTIGTIGGGCAEADMMQIALRMLRSDHAEPQVVRVNMTNQDAGDEGMVCGGIQDLFLELC